MKWAVSFVHEWAERLGPDRFLVRASGANPGLWPLRAGLRRAVDPETPDASSP